MTLELFGTFREETGTALGDPYDKAKSISSRFKGKQFNTPGPVSGKLTTSYIQKDFQNTTPGDLYRDPSQIEKLVNCRPAGQPAGQKPFVPPNNTKKSACAGSADGCLGPVYLDTEPPPSSRALVRPSTTPADGKRKIYTSPTKKGGFGFPLQARTLGVVEGYVPDPYQPGRIIERELRRSARAKFGKAFISAGIVRHGYWDDKGLYGPPGPTYNKQQRAQAPLWRPSSPPKKGAAYCAISKVGRDYIPDPVPAPEFQSNQKGQAVFRPPSGPKARLSMWAVNKYTRDARAPPDLDFTLL